MFASCKELRARCDLRRQARAHSYSEQRRLPSARMRPQARRCLFHLSDPLSPFSMLLSSIFAASQAILAFRHLARSNCQSIPSGITSRHSQIEGLPPSTLSILACSSVACVHTRCNVPLRLRIKSSSCLSALVSAFKLRPHIYRPSSLFICFALHIQYRYRNDLCVRLSQTPTYDRDRSRPSGEWRHAARSQSGLSLLSFLSLG